MEEIEDWYWKSREDCRLWQSSRLLYVDAQSLFSFFCFPFGKYLFTVFTFVVLLNYRKQTPFQRFKDVFQNFD